MKQEIDTIGDNAEKCVPPLFLSRHPSREKRKRIPELSKKFDNNSNAEKRSAKIDSKKRRRTDNIVLIRKKSTISRMSEKRSVGKLKRKKKRAKVDSSKSTIMTKKGSDKKSHKMGNC